jgi:HEPN domain-containing protein
MTKRQKYLKIYAPELLRIAKSDLESAKILNAASNSRPETTVFHVQQAIEKSIKAVTCHLEIPILLIHDIGALLGCLPQDKLPPYDYDLTKFNDYAGILRYEEGKAVLDPCDVEAAIGVGLKIIEWAQTIIK